MKLADQPAFPGGLRRVVDVVDGKQVVIEVVEGMTLRQYYAGLAMQGTLAGRKSRIGDQSKDAQKTEWFAERAVMLADALIAELEKQP